LFDDKIRRLIDAPLACAGGVLAASGAGAEAISIGGCAPGLAAAITSLR
jgi:hypothetical protein